MTTSTSPHDPLESWRRPMRINDPGDLLAAVPALLGFPPGNSVVVIVLGGEFGTSIGAVMRHDLIRPTPDEVASGRPAAAMLLALEQFALVAEREHARSVVAVFVDDGHDLDEVAYDIADAMGDSLAEVGAVLAGAHVVRAIEHGERWWSLLGDPRSGRVPDPEASTITAAHVLDGRRIRASRAELEELLAPAPLADRLLVAEHVETIGADVVSGTGGIRRMLDRLLSHVAYAASGELPQPAEVAELGAALSNHEIRDCMLALAMGDSSDAAEQLWIHLARTLPDPLRSQSALLLGHSAYVRGEGPLAGIALGVALEADPSNALASLLDNALQCGLRPESVRKIARTGVLRARLLGVDLTPPGS